MPPRKVTEADGSTTGLTPAENKFIKTMFDNMKTRPDADWDKVAEQMGLKDSKCAKERFRQIAQRHGWNNKSDSSTGKVTKKPAAGGRKKATQVKKRDEEDDDEMDSVEVKKLVKKQAGGQKKRVKTEESDTEEESVKNEDNDTGPQGLS
jgi:hypothetical protein